MCHCGTPNWKGYARMTEDVTPRPDEDPRITRETETERVTETEETEVVVTPDSSPAKTDDVPPEDAGDAGDG